MDQGGAAQGAAPTGPEGRGRDSPRPLGTPHTHTRSAGARAAKRDRRTDTQETQAPPDRAGGNTAAWPVWCSPSPGKRPGGRRGL